MKMGFGMGGIEDRIIAIARDVAARFSEITYIEIGVGEGATLTAIASTLDASHKKWRTIGIELPNGYSFSRELTEQHAKRRNIKLNFITPNSSIVHPAWGAVTVYFQDSQSFLTELWQEPIQLALIDGCHGKPCVKADFIALEAFMVEKGTIMFHDLSEDQNDRHDWQPHCSTGLDVRGACYELGLLTGRRKGWRFTEMLGADKLKGGWDMGVFTKEAKLING